MLITRSSRCRRSSWPRQAERLQSRDTLIEKLKAQLAVLKRARFGASSEKIERAIAQLELVLEDIEAAAAETAPPIPPTRDEAPKAKPARQPLPDHLPRHEVVARGRRLRLPDLRRPRLPQGRHGGQRDAGLCAGLVPRAAPRPAAPRLQRLRYRDHRGDALGADRARQAFARADCACADRQILRSPSTLSPIGDLRPRGHRPSTLHHGRLGRQGQRPAGAADRGAAQPCVCWRSPAWRRHADPRAGAGARQDQDRAAMDLCS